MTRIEIDTRVGWPYYCRSLPQNLIFFLYACMSMRSSRGRCCCLSVFLMDWVWVCEGAPLRTTEKKTRRQELLCSQIRIQSKPCFVAVVLFSHWLLAFDVTPALCPNLFYLGAHELADHKSGASRERICRLAAIR